MQAFSSCFYGSQLWDLSNNIIERLCTYWRKSTRKAFNIPQRTIPAADLSMRFVKLFLKGLDSDSDTFCFLMRQSNANRYSTIGKNVKNMMYTYHIPTPTMFGGNASVVILI